MGVLIDAAELHARLADPELRTVDVRWYLGRPGAGRAAYEQGHIPGAIFLDLDDDISDHDGLGAPGRHPLPSPQEFARRLGERGIGSSDFVVAYDDAGGAVAARLWWMLDNLGHRGGAAVLDGGIGAWQAGGYELSRDAPDLQPQRLELGTRWRNVIERDELAQRIGDVTLLDGRAAERYRGDIEPVDPVAGHIPGAHNVPVTDNIGSDGRLRTADELRSRYRKFVSADVPVVVSCGSGTTACHNALAMRLGGLPEPLLYVGSFSDWSRSGMPVAPGSMPGEM
jgi:thiosulfate/3-mercaptopyruvate sulfurtransferase